MRSILVACFFILLILGPQVSASVVINEVLPQPASSGGEWVELYNNGSGKIEMKEWFIADLKDNDTFTMNLTSNSYGLILDSVLNCSDFNTSCLELSAIGLGLNNNDENLSLYNRSGGLIDQVSWNDSTENISMGRVPDGGKWNHSLSPTPGRSNRAGTGSPENSTNSLDNTSNTSGNYNTSCNLEVKVETKGDETPIVQDGETFYYDINVSDGNCSDEDRPFELHYWIEDLDGTREHEYSDNYSLEDYDSTRQWTPDVDSSTGAFWIKANLTETYCNDSNQDNNFAEKLLVVKKNVSQTRKRDNFIQILDHPENAKFGETLLIDVKIGKNNTNEYAVYARIERTGDGRDVSEETRVHLKDENRNYTLAIPVLLKPNCDKRYDSGTYRIVVRGLGVNDTEEIKISGIKDSVCEEITKVKEVSSSSSGGGGGGSIGTAAPTEKKYELFSFPEQAQPGGGVEIIVLLRNQENETKNLTVYSYLYDGQYLASEGGWTPNKKTVNLKPSENRILTLKNRIKSGAKLGAYNLKVRIKDEKDMVREMEIVESGENETKLVGEVGGNASTGNGTSRPEKGAGTANVSEESKVMENISKGEESRGRITGKVFRKRGPLEKFLGLLEGIFDFF